MNGTHGVHRVLCAIDAGSDDAHARPTTRDIAPLLQAAPMQRSGDAVFAAFGASRLDGAADAFDLLIAGTDFDAIIRSAMPEPH